ncbi:MAG: aminotransferase class V-fold PLP-dependent enzyme, partial [Planctomycetota bacterium]
CLASVMMANNEIGVVQPLAEIAAECRRRGVLLHTDATQAVGKLPVDVRSLGVDLMSFTAHKLYGPKGVGALYVRSRDPVVRLDPLVTGGGQEAGRRAGTLNVPGIVGFAAAVELCGAEMSSEAARLSEMRDALAAGLLRGVPGVEICGPSLGGDGPDAPIRLPGNLMVTFGDVDGEAIQLHCPGLAMSSGAACSSADAEPSHVLQAIGLSPDAARCSLRIGLGRFNTAADIEAAIAGIAAAVARLRNRPAA